MAQKPDPKPPVEIIPSVEGDLSAIGSANAPFIYFDTAPTFGFHGGVANVTLDAFRHMHAFAKPTHDRVVTAHLRMSLDAVHSLRAALDGVLLIATPAPEGKAN